MEWKVKFARQIDIGFGFTDDGFEINLPFIKVVRKRRNYSWETTEPKKVVVADSFNDFLDWCMRTNNSPKMFKMVERSEHLDELIGQQIDLYYIGDSAVTNPILKDMKWNKIDTRRAVYCYD